MTAPPAAGPPRRRAVLALALLLAVLGGAVATDRLVRRTEPQPVAAAAPVGMPALPPGGTVSAAWFCPGGPLSATGGSDVTVTIANPASEPVDARVEVHPQAGSGTERATREVSVPAHGTSTVRLGEVLGTDTPAGATVVAYGSVAVSQSLRAGEGQATGPCASATSETWHTAVGSTAAGSTLLLSLFNPFPGDAIVDLWFATDQGRTVPIDLQGIVVPGRSLVVIDVGDKVRRRDAVSANVRAREGRLVVGRNLRLGNGASTALGAPLPAPTWYFPNGVRTDGTSSRVTVSNPGDEDAEVSLEIRVADGAVEPLNLAVPAQESASISLDEGAVPRNVGYSLTVRSEGQVPVVVERTVATRASRTDVLGARLASTRWVLLPPGPRGLDVLSVLNTAASQATLRLVALDGTGRPAGEPVAVAAGGRVGLVLHDRLTTRSAALLVESDVPVVVERGAGDSGPTLGALIGVPDRSTVT